MGLYVGFVFEMYKFDKKSIQLDEIREITMSYLDELGGGGGGV